MTMKMAAIQPEEIITNAKEESHELMDEENDKSQRGPDSPDGVDGLSPGVDEDEREREEGESESDDESESGSESEDEEEEEEQVEELSAADLLAFSKSRLQKAPQAPPPVAAEPTQTDGDEDEDDASDDENSDDEADSQDVAEASEQLDSKASAPESLATNSAHSEEKKTEADVVPQASEEEPVVKDQSYYIELAMKKTQEAEEKAKNDLELAMKKSQEAEEMAKNDEDPAYVMKLAEEKVKEANAKAKEDEEQTSENVIKPALSAKPTRDENQELWALLNYSKRRLETGSTPQVGKKGGRKSTSRSSSVRGDDNMSVSSKLSKSSRRSLGSRKSITVPIAVEGGPDDLKSPLGSQPPDEDKEAEKMDTLFHKATDHGDGDDSVDGSVSLESGKGNSVDNKYDEESENSDDEDEDSSSDEEEEEDELPDFLQDKLGEEIDPESAKQLYEAAKFKAASILSVSEEKLTDVQMLQAIAIAEEAAKKGDEKFSTKRSLFKLNEAKVEDLKNFLNIGSTPRNGQEGAAIKAEREQVAWGFGRGRFVKKMGAVFQDFKEKCDEIDDKMTKEREGKPSNKEMLSAAMLDLKAQIEELESKAKVVTKKGNP